MPASIALVGAGRCRPTPDGIALGASPDRDARRIVPGRLAGGAGEGVLPVLGAPAGGVGGVDGDDRDAGGVGHGGQAGAEPAGGHAGDQLPEAALAAVLLPRLLGGEVQVLDGAGLHAAGGGPVQQSGPGLQRLEIRVGTTPGQRPLIMRRLGDRTRPTGRRKGCQRALAHRPRPGIMIQPVTTTRCQITGRECAQMRADLPQYLHIGSGELLESGTHRYPGRVRHDERRRKPPQTTHPTPPHSRDNPVHLTQRTALPRVTHSTDRLPFPPGHQALRPHPTLTRSHQSTLIHSQRPAVPNPGALGRQGARNESTAIRAAVPITASAAGSTAAVWAVRVKTATA